MRNLATAVLVGLVFAKLWLVFHMLREYRHQPEAFDVAKVATYTLWFATIWAGMVVVGLAGTRLG